MFRQIMDAVIREQNLGLVRRDIAAHWACRCTVPGPGMHQAAEILVRRYRENGAEAELLAYPADATTPNLGAHTTGLEWRPGDSCLEIVAPSGEAEVICRYRDEPLSLVCYSTATPPEGIVAEVVVRSGLLAPEQVTEGEFAGQLLFTDMPPSSVELAAEKGGAVGILSDCVCPPWLAGHPPIREPEDAPDLVMWTIFSPNRTDRQVFGFNLSGRQGRRLRKLLATATEPVKLRATVAAETLVGVSDLVNAWLPGTDLAAEEIWVLGHLSEPGARDNASGCCLAVELARVLKKLTSDGTLPPLRRTIRFLHATEVSGFLPYIAAHQDRLPQIIAGLCLDSVGQDFAKCGGEVVLDRSPEQNASFVDGLMETLLRAAAAEPVERFTTQNYATFPWHTEPFWGNDAFISDGFFDIPTPHVFNWPDRYYHSSQDTPDQMCDNTLGRFGAIDGTYLYLLATAGAHEAYWLAQLAAADWKRRLAQSIGDRLTELLAEDDPEAHALTLGRQLLHLAFQGVDAINQTARFAPENDELLDALDGLTEDFAHTATFDMVGAVAALGADADEAEALLELPEGEDSDSIYARKVWHCPPATALSAAGHQALVALAAEGHNLGRIWPWLNGRRGVAEIWARLLVEGEIPLSVIGQYLRLMAEEGFAEEV